MFVMKKNMDMKMIEKLHDCFILDFNPYEQKSCSFKKYDGVYITAEKGQVALKDYPHPRHLCTRYPFHKTPHSKFCSRCYCYVCDVAAPCKHWSTHCDATDLYPYWSILRKFQRIIEEGFNTNLSLALRNSNR
ncbi:RPM1 interacting protein 13-like [Spinacia oleracea]|nr:RPM1 interacting protein 13-like [Spinacia oleracea]